MFGGVSTVSLIAVAAKPKTPFKVAQQESDYVHSCYADLLLV